MKQSALAVAAFILFATAQHPASAAQLVMLEQPGCVWCAQFNKEIAPIWPKTDEGRCVPLRRVDITRAWPADLSRVNKERFTPTFVLVESGEELGRLRGYPGDQFFWFRIGELLAKLPTVEGKC